MALPIKTYATPTFTVTPTETESPDVSATPNDTGTMTATPELTGTETQDPAMSSTITPTITETWSETAADTFTFTPTITTTGTDTYTDVPTNTDTDTATYTYTLTQTDSITPTSSYTMTSTPADTPSVTETITDTCTPTFTISQTHTASPNATDTYSPTATQTATPYGEGSAVISPLTAAEGTTGNTMTITYTAGPTAWGSGTLRLIIPAGWSAPSLSGASAGFYSVAVSGGTLMSNSKSGQIITVSVNALAANSGTITIIYGSRASLGPGAIAQSGPGTAIFSVESNPNGATTYAINTQPQVLMTVATATATSTLSDSPTLTATLTATASPSFTITPTAVTGEGTESIAPNIVTKGATGITLVMDYITGPTAWAASPGYGTLKISIPAGWSAPDFGNNTTAGYFSVVLNGGTYMGSSAAGQDIIVRAADLLPGQRIRVTYGDKSSGGPGATAQSTGGNAVFYTESNYSGTTTYRIANQPVVLVATATSTYTVTITLTPTNTSQFTPAPPSSLNISQSGNNTTLSWNNPAQTDYYKIYYTSGAAGKKNIFPGAWQQIATVIPTPGVSAFTHIDATGNAYGYYIITGINAAGESKPSSMVTKVLFNLKHNTGTTSAYRPSLPYDNKFTTASSIVPDIEGNTYTGNRINQLLLWNPVSQTSSVYQYITGFGSWNGNNWTVDAGTLSSNAIYMNVVSTFTWIVAGKDKLVPLYFNYNSFVSGLTNINKRSLPYGSVYLKASDIVLEIEGGIGVGTNTKINKLMSWDEESQTYRVFMYLSAFSGWFGNDFDIKPGDSLSIFPVSSFTWTPKLVITPVP